MHSKHSLTTLLLSLFTCAALFLVGCATGDSGGGASAEQFMAITKHDGRTYVLGSAETLVTFNEQKSIPYSKTYIGKAADGGTIIFEIDKDDEGMQQRLIDAYSKQYNVEL